MANITKLNTRIQLKYDSIDNWAPRGSNGERTWINFIPLKGEVCVINPGDGTAGTTSSSTCLIKVGDGVTNIGDLPWLSAQAADVHTWAKMSATDFVNWMEGTKEISGLTRPALVTEAHLNDLLEGLIDEQKGEATIKDAVLRIAGEAAEAAIDDLGEALADAKKDGGAAIGNTDLLIGYTYDKTNNTFTAKTRSVDTVPTKNSTSPITSGAVYGLKADYDGKIKAINEAIDDIEERTVETKADPNSVEATVAVVSVAEDVNGNITATTQALPSMAIIKGGTAENGTVTYISSVEQTNGKIAATTSTIEAATLAKLGLVRLNSNTNTAASAEAVASLAEAIDGINGKITNAMHFLGITTTKLADGATTTDLAGIKKEDITAGAVILAPYADSNERYEFVWTGTAWEMLGQEGSFAIKGSVANVDIAPKAAIEQTKIAASGNFKSATNLKGDMDAISTNLTSINEFIDDAKSFAKVTDGTHTAEADDHNDTLTFAAADDDYVTLTVAVDGTSDKVTYTAAHATPANYKSTVTPVPVDDSKPQEITHALAHEGTFTVVDSLVRDAKGHVTEIKTKKYALPSVDDIAGELDKTWKTNNLKTYNAAASAAAGQASDLSIAGTDITYIIFDCGSASKNV